MMEHTSTDRELILAELDAAAAAVRDASHSSKDIRVAAEALRDIAVALEVSADAGRQLPRVTIFGSARLGEGTRAHAETFECARLLAASGWQVVTGGGPGLMEAGLTGAASDGEGHALGVAIDLPFEKPAGEVRWPLARQSRFFTRKLALVRNVRAFVAAPGGLGTLDELFEVLTLLQTGKAKPAPVVLLDAGTGLWHDVDALIRRRLASIGVISSDDVALYEVVEDAQSAAAAVSRFWSGYRGMRRLADGRCLLLTSRPLTEGELAPLAVRFSESMPGGLAPHPSGVSVGFDQRSFGALRMLIDAVSDLASDRAA